MKRYRIGLTLIAFVFALLPLFLLDRAVAEEPGLASGGFQWGGSIELGYRFTDIDGRNRYKETVNLMDGLRLFDFNLYGKNLQKNSYVDSFQLSGTGIGDPFPSARLQVKKDKTYDVVATYREYKFFFDRAEDDLLTSDGHDFNQKRRRGSLNVALFPKDDVRVNVGYGYADRTGDSIVPRAFLDVNDQDLKERLDQYFVSADFPIGNWDFHVKQTFWSFKNRSDVDGPESIERRDETTNTYVSTIKAHTKLNDRWDLDAGYVYAHSNGTASLPTSEPGAVNVVPGRSHFDSNIHIAELGLSHLLLTNLIAHLDYRFHIDRKDGVSHTDDELTRTDFNLQAHTGTFQLEYLPVENLTLRAGYRLQYRGINGDNVDVNDHDGGRDPASTKIWTHGWIASADWKPYKFLSFYGEYQGAQFDNPYTRISPEHENIAKAKIKYKPVKDLSLNGIFAWKRKTNPDQSFRVDAQDYTLSLNYQPSFIQGLSLDGAVTYERIIDKKDIVLEDETLQRFVFDSNAVIWTGGISYEGIYRGLGARLNGSYAATRKENSQRYADGVFSIWYKNKCVTPVITLERTYLNDRVHHKDSFDANLLTISLRKEF
jgi:hypothetical protein